MRRVVLLFLVSFSFLGLHADIFFLKNKITNFTKEIASIPSSKFIEMLSAIANNEDPNTDIPQQIIPIDDSRYEWSQGKTKSGMAIMGDNGLDIVNRDFSR